ncbi:unnamed protein product [Paramecium sonneborni]|uniref:Uncharacterized protein n=1 Tax=Paramecium sonneborni TaxID=65129 RepID=A0A8S1KDD8_9CILI|nr:unnamed protein product [Paramecium sonneborni]
MAKKMMSQPGLVEEFIKIVDSFGGEDCRNWAHVARILFNACQFQVKSPQKLKRIYESFKKPKQELSNIQFSKLLEIDIKSRGNHVTATKDFFNQTGVRMSQCRFKEHAVLGIRNSLKVLVKILGIQKKAIQTVLSRFSYTSIQIMFRAADCKYQDVLIQEIKQYALLFEQAYLIYAENHHKSQPELFDLLKPIMNRRQFRRCLFYLFFVDELKSISLKQTIDDNDLKNHPLLQKTIELNKKLPFYQRVVNLCDREEKYNMYCTYNNNIDNEFCKIYLNECELKKKKSQKARKQNENLRTVRGKIHQPGDQLFRGWKTVVFEADEDIIQNDGRDQMQNELKRKKMQELYEIAFGDDNNNNNNNY